jgi:hypothetical protein
MRTVILMIILIATTVPSLAQEAEESMELSVDRGLTEEVVDSTIIPLSHHLHQVEAQQKNAFRMFPNEATARVRYYWLLNHGYDLEAARFRQNNYSYAFALNPHRRGFESIYAEVGSRISGNANAGNIYNAGYGGFFRVSGTVRIWHSVSYVQQDNNLGHYKQGEYFSALYTYLGSGWYIKPSLHYTYASFTDLLHDSYPVNYLDSFENFRGRYTVYKTSAIQDIDYITQGHSHYLNVGLPVTRRYYQWTIEVQPSLQYINTQGSRSYNYSNAGTTDSFRNNELKGTETYTETGSGTLSDTSTNVFIGQLGGSVGYHFQVLDRPVYVRAGGWYLFSDRHANTMAYNAYALVQASNSVWLHLSFLAKGNLPFALASEGLYLNMYHEIKARTGFTVQFFPLKKWSPLLTYQYEKQVRFGDGASLVYHALYLTLKYNL